MPRAENHVHFIGIGGSGMSGIARILLGKGYRVSGSDLRANDVTERLQKMGAEVYLGHAAKNVGDVDLVVVSTAIPADNQELAAAREKGIPLISRGEMLARIMDDMQGIAIAGTHGKTTTSSMTSLVFELCGLQPTIVVGGDLQDLGDNAKNGEGPYMVAEADESDGSFLKLAPFIAVITNIESDHLDYYGSEENIFRAFKDFMDRLKPGGKAVVCLDNPGVQRLIEEKEGLYITYGTTQDCSFWAAEISSVGLGGRARVYRGEEELGWLELNVPGRHNIINAMAAVAVGMEVGLDFSSIAGALKQFHGVKRRFQVVGEVDGFKVVDDYAHHPSEIAATLQAARQSGASRVIAVFQPHRYTRTKFLGEEFGKAFGDADMVILDALYSAGEKPIPGVSSELIKEAIEKNNSRPVYYIPSQEKIVSFLSDIARPGDLILTMGAGNIWLVGRALVDSLKVG